jgi:hypothetical protein
MDASKQKYKETSFGDASSSSRENRGITDAKVAEGAPATAGITAICSSDASNISDAIATVETQASHELSRKL